MMSVPKKLLHLVHGWLSKDLQLPLPTAWQCKKGRIYTFAAFLGGAPRLLSALFCSFGIAKPLVICKYHAHWCGNSRRPTRGRWFTMRISVRMVWKKNRLSMKGLRGTLTQIEVILLGKHAQYKKVGQFLALPAQSDNGKSLKQC